MTLEVVGRKTGDTTRIPLGMADWQGDWCLASMLGDCNWVRTVRAVHGHATLYRRRPRPVLLTEIGVEQRAPILKRYLAAVPGGRPHFPVDWRERMTSFEAITAQHPVFLVRDRPAGGILTSGSACAYAYRVTGSGPFGARLEGREGTAPPITVNPAREVQQ